MSISIEMDLKEILTKLDQRLEKIEQKIDRLEDKIDQKIDRLEDKIDQKIDSLEQKIDNLDEKFERKIDNIQKDISDLKAGQARIEGELTGINKRLDNQEFLSRGILVGFMIAILGGLAKLFGFIANP